MPSYDTCSGCRFFQTLVNGPTCMAPFPCGRVKPMNLKWADKAVGYRTTDVDLRHVQHREEDADGSHGKLT